MISDVIKDFDGQPEVLWGKIFYKGNQFPCLLVKKVEKAVKFNNCVYKKVEGYPVVIEEDAILYQNPDLYTSLNCGFLFLPSLFRFKESKQSESWNFVELEKNFLNTKSDIDLFFKWIEEIRGESELTEFKGVIKDNKTQKDTLAKQLVAFSNTNSGILMVGINETINGSFDIVGIKDPDKEQREIINIINNSLKNVDGDFLPIKYLENDLLLFLIKKSKNLASYNYRVYKRMGRHSREIKTENIKDFHIEIFEKKDYGYLFQQDFNKWKRNKSNK
ncbi:MAG: hypothetical protein HeimC3_26040 [Candidatus Heimdallarchaeota archaeon LC_3]|nr:MAG: hypothetical protein HeimC3_26040 [Candidatus Heimdallarchaeota archaeon LC_3]